MEQQMSSIQPPERASTFGSVVVVMLITLFTLVFHFPGARIWLLVAIVLLTATAVLLRQAPAIHSGLLGLLIIIVFATPLSAAWPLSGLFAIGVYAAVVRRTKLLRTSSGWVRKGRPTRTDLLLSVVLGLLTFVAVMAWVWLVKPDLSGQAAGIPDALWFMVVTGVVFAVVNSFVEEVIYRGVFMYALEAALGTWPAFVLQAVFFGLLHLQGFPSGPYGMLLAGVVGLVLGFLRLRTHGMLAPWLTHAVANGLMYLYLALL
jgi:membrane protease YdiL (CAAX protease family)